VKKILLVALILLLCVSLFGCASGVNRNQLNEEGQDKGDTQQTDKSDAEAVSSLVEGFGSKLQAVSLLAPKDILEKSMRENYGEFVSETLIAKWISDPLSATGRLTSSPWPDRIEILSLGKLSEDTYKVKGKIIEITSTEKESGGIAAKRPITLVVKKINNNWLIDDVMLGSYEENNSVVYRNTQYGFSFSLPESWKDYKIAVDKWEGLSLADLASSKIAETGPLIYIRHPQWTSEKPRQDIPIMIFTLTQWDSLQQGKYHIGAAPIGPSELARNTKYVFALPARYNYAFPAGYEEVEDILKGNPLKPLTD
jgi:hypothetical protein